MRLRLGALVATWLVASLAAGIASTAMGYAENLRGDGSVLGILDATGGWLLGTLGPACFFLTFFFLPIAILLQWRDVHGPLPYVIGGGVSGALVMAVFVWPEVYDTWFWLLVVPGSLAGATWWGLVIRRRSDDDVRVAHE